MDVRNLASGQLVGTVQGGLFNAGHVYLSVERVNLLAEIYDEFGAWLTERVVSLAQDGAVGSTGCDCRVHAVTEPHIADLGTRADVVLQCGRRRQLRQPCQTSCRVALALRGHSLLTDPVPLGDLGHGRTIADLGHGSEADLDHDSSGDDRIVYGSH